MSNVRQLHGFARTKCACLACQAACRHVPGSLDPSDLQHLCPPGEDLLRWSEQHLRAVIDKQVPTLVPARQANGHCHWYYEGRCLVHEHAPYSCAFFDTHMTDEDIDRRSSATMQARREDAAKQGVYFQVWQHLCRRGLTLRSADRRAFEDEVRRIGQFTTSLQASGSGEDRGNIHREAFQKFG